MIAFSGNVEKKLLQLTVTGKEHEEFVQLLRRGCNTWDTKPKWVQQLADAVADVPGSVQLVKPE